MDKKKLGLMNKNKLELSKTVGSGTVKQSFSHGRVKSVAVEVKKVRTFDKNSSAKHDRIDKSLNLKSNDENLKESTTSSILEKNKENFSKNNLQKIKDAAHSNKIDMENKISSRQEEEFRNQKHQFQNKKILNQKM